jgi:ribose 5-phosphate isomerase A
LYNFGVRLKFSSSKYPIALPGLKFWPSLNENEIEPFSKVSKGERRFICPMNKDIEGLKKQAAHRAVEYVKSGMIVGLGTGSTVRYALELIGSRIRQGELKDIMGIPTSIQTEKLSREYGIPLTTLEEHPEIDITIDGADEVDPQRDLIKGGGGALFKEKIIAQASRRNIIIVDEQKLSPCLGTKWPVPVEVFPFAWKPEMNYLTSLGAKARIRKKDNDVPFITDQGNMILDSDFGPIAAPGHLDSLLHARAGIIEHGLFLGLASEVIVAGHEGIRLLPKGRVGHVAEG